MSNKDRITTRMKAGVLFLILAGGFGIAILWSMVIPEKLEEVHIVFRRLENSRRVHGLYYAS